MFLPSGSTRLTATSRTSFGSRFSHSLDRAVYTQVILAFTPAGILHTGFSTVVSGVVTTQPLPLACACWSARTTVTKSARGKMVLWIMKKPGCVALSTSMPKYDGRRSSISSMVGTRFAGSQTSGGARTTSVLMNTTMFSTRRCSMPRRFWLSRMPPSPKTHWSGVSPTGGPCGVSPGSTTGQEGMRMVIELLSLVTSASGSATK
mmetsp:Transcript_38461/g.100692  ORF Transcript_38461/g.100692 Transcript_38461/m.100692 type:complete len:205 (+) Transcript_38461:199-813(+)